MSAYLLLSEDVRNDLLERMIAKRDSLLAKEFDKPHIDASRFVMLQNILEPVERLELPEYITAEDAASLEEFMEF